MKDLAHHLKKLNRRIIRSAHREEMAEEEWAEPTKQFTPQEYPDIETSPSPQVIDDWRTRPNKSVHHQKTGTEYASSPKSKAPKQPTKQEMRQVRKPKAQKKFESQDPFENQVMAHPQKKVRTGRSPYSKTQTMNELKKQTKRATRKMRQERSPTPLTPEDQNKWMKHRTPVFDRLNNAKPKMGARASKKKTPRI